MNTVRRYVFGTLTEWCDASRDQFPRIHTARGELLSGDGQERFSWALEPTPSVKRWCLQPTHFVLPEPSATVFATHPDVVKT